MKTGHEPYAGTLAIVVATLLPGCLPADTRPEPGSILTTASGSDATRDGVTSADGWALEFDRVLLSIGPMQLGDSCTKYAEYSEPGYDRVVELTVPSPQKLSIMYGLGQCDIDFQVSPPTEDAVLSAGVTEAEKTFMRTPGSDRYVGDDGIALRVEGSATRETRTLSFAWSLRQTLFYDLCGATINGRVEQGLDLRGGVPLVYNLRIEIEGLFRDDVAPDSAALAFTPFAEADARGNGDGTIELEELALVPLSELRATAPYTGGAADEVATLEDYVYRMLYPTLVRYRDTGFCAVHLSEPD